MLSKEETTELEKQLAHCYNKRSACIDALKTIQKFRGWVSDQALKDIAVYLGMTPDELDNAATFYNLIFRKPAGRHVVLVCDGIACWIMGGETIAAYLSGKLGIGPGQTTDDGRFTLIPNTCIGACDRAPAMIIDEQLYTELTPEKIDAVLDRYK